MFDAVALLTELAQKVAAAREAESKAFDAYLMAEVTPDEREALFKAYNHAVETTQKAERALSTSAINQLIRKSI